MIGQRLRGFVGQGMNGARKAITPEVFVFPPGSTLFTPARSGKYRLILWGAGGGGGFGGANVGGSSGALVIAERVLIKGQPITLSIAVGGVTGADGAASTVTFRPGDVITAGGGGEGQTPNAAGVASSTNNLDILINGSLAGVAGLGGSGGTSAGGFAGGGAPGRGNYRGANATTAIGQATGCGGVANSNNVAGAARLMVHQIALRP